MSSVDWYKVYKRLAIRFKEKLAKLSSKTNKIHERTYLMSESAVLCGYVHIY